jgi:tRNA dimethylallyltransferase
MKKKVLVITGPTATGKTDLAIKLAKKYNGELIACDSRQVYKGLDLGTGKLPSADVRYEKKEGFWLIDGIKVWLYDIASPQKRYSLTRYVKDTEKVIKSILNEDRLPIIVGGTGLYLNALLYGLEESNIPINSFLRKELEKKDLLELQGRLKNLSPDIFHNLNNSERNNSRRLIRHIEKLTNSPKATNESQKSLVSDFDILIIGLTAKKEFLDKRIDIRLEKRFKQGMIKEVEKLKEQGLTFKRMRELGLEYRVLADFLKGKFKTQQELIINLKEKNRQYAKRQMTWFKKQKDIHWFDIESKDFNPKVEEFILDWYNQA